MLQKLPVVEVSGSHEGRVFDKRTVEYLIGDALEHNLPDGLDMALMKFKKSEVSEVTFSGDYAFGANPPAEYGLPADATVKYMVSLIKSQILQLLMMGEIIFGHLFLVLCVVFNHCYVMW